MISVDLETEIKHVVTQLIMHMQWSPIKTLKTEVWVSFPSWQSSMCIVIIAEKVTLPDSSG